MIIFAAEHIGPVRHDVVVVYSDRMSRLQAIEGEDTENLLFAVSWTCSGYWVTRARAHFCWIPSHCGIEANGSGTTGKRQHGPWHRPTGKCPLHRSEVTGQLRHPARSRSLLFYMQFKIFYMILHLNHPKLMKLVTFRWPSGLNI